MRNTSTPTTSAQPDLNSSSSSSNFEFSSPITKPPPITLNDFITLSQLKGPDIPNQTYSPPPPASTHVAEVHVVRSPSSDLPGFPGTTQPDSASLVKRINELINQRESLIDKISELSSKLSQYEVNVHANLPLSSFRSSKIAIFSDSMLRGVAQLMHQHINTISSNTKITSMIKPNAYFSQVTEGVESQCRDFGANDFVIIQAGTNDMNTYVYIILEYCDGGDLCSFIRSHEKLSEFQCQQFVRQLVLALKFLRENNVCHFDLKPQNILIKNNTLKLAVCSQHCEDS
ncbi:serine/threonine-protein kinase RAD53-like [Diaphorina citri]|uniref:non-specific serine/threonine protein kinase n=1 Tax=Diaphorina citri TaxID=121845 RepID=A0A1S3DLS8_DIACI|nr:serine/threonine-protein kinase RAD53-like [Diaphorina citri]